MSAVTSRDETQETSRSPLTGTGIASFCKSATQSAPNHATRRGQHTRFANVAGCRGCCGSSLQHSTLLAGCGVVRIVASFSFSSPAMCSAASCLSGSADCEGSSCCRTRLQQSTLLAGCGDEPKTGSSSIERPQPVLDVLSAFWTARLHAFAIRTAHTVSARQKHDGRSAVLRFRSEADAAFVESLAPLLSQVGHGRLL